MISFLRQRGIAERMIESFMLIANETVAEHFTRLKLLFIYRIHEDPKAEKVQKFIDYASSFGIQIYGTASEMSQEALQEIMRKVEGEPYADVLFDDVVALDATGPLFRAQPWALWACR